MAGKRIVVAGSINMDLVVSLDRMPRPGETVVGKDVQYIPGGKGSNQAIAARRLGDVPVALIGRLGQDTFGDDLHDFLQTQDLLLNGVTRSEKPTGTAIITIDATSENAIIVVPGANFDLTAADIDRMESLIEDAGVAVSQLEVSLDATEHFLVMSKSKGVTTILNAAPARKLSQSILSSVDYLVVNEMELAFLVGQDEIGDDRESVIAEARKLQSQGPPNIVVTLGSKGSITLAGDEVISIDGLTVEAVDPTGAGDTFVGGLAAELNAGVNLTQALDYANRAAALAVQRMGASSSIPFRDEVGLR